MFHWVTGIPFHSDLHGGVYDDLTLWEQIDGGAHYTPAKKWLLTVPIMLYVPSKYLTTPLFGFAHRIHQVPRFYTLYTLQSLVVCH